MSQFIKFYFTSSMLNMFRTLIHPSSGACDFSIVSPHVSDNSSVHHEEFFNVNTAQLQFSPDPARKLSANLYDIYHCCVLTFC